MLKRQPNKDFLQNNRLKLKLFAIADPDTTYLASKCFSKYDCTLLPLKK